MCAHINASMVRSSSPAPMLFIDIQKEYAESAHSIGLSTKPTEQSPEKHISRGGVAHALKQPHARRMVVFTAQLHDVSRKIALNGRIAISSSEVTN